MKEATSNKKMKSKGCRSPSRSKSHRQKTNKWGEETYKK
jgi:hypothetical protein